jgi:hypothetical protein
MTHPQTGLVKTVVPAVVTGLFLGFLAAVCAGKEQSAFATPSPGPSFGANDRIATITLKRDPDGNFTGFNEPSSDDPKSHGKQLALSKKRDHKACWIVSPPGADVTLTIQMDNGNAPFDAPIKCKGNECTSTHLDKTLTPSLDGTEYSYSIKVKDNKTGTELTKDPIIRVDP